jgi:acyl-CoA synthetase (AMP-forming)/AMP-acid ligase II
MINQLNFLFRTFEKNKNKIAIIQEDIKISYKRLIDRCIYYDGFIAANGICSGQVVSLQADYSLDSIALLLSLIRNNCIVVPFDINLSRIKTDKLCEVAEVDYMCTKVPGGINCYEEDATSIHMLYQELDVGRKHPGLVLFTSGSTGEPKGIVHDFVPLLNKFKVKKRTFTTIPFLLFDHMGGINTLFYTLSNVGTLVIPYSKIPDRICSLIELYKVELLPTSPTFLKLLLLSEAYKEFNLSSLKIISYGTESMPETILKRLNDVFPNVKFQQTYGSSEIGVLRSKSKSNDSLWVKLGGEDYKIKVVDGVLHVKTKSSIIGYLNIDKPVLTDDGWFNTGDRVEVKGDYFKILGRDSEIINAGGYKVFPQEVENIILCMDEVKDVTVYGEKHNILGNIVCAQINFRGDFKDYERKIRNHCIEKGLEFWKIPIKYTVIDEITISDRFKKVR